MRQLRLRVITPVGARYMTPGGIDQIKESGKIQSEYRIDTSVNLDGKLTFTGDDYKYFEKLDNSVYRCDTTSVMLQQLKTGTVEVWENVRESKISMRSGDWDKSKCTVAFSLISEDRYIKLDDKKDKEYNVLDLVTQKYAAKWIGIDGNPTTAANGVRVYDCLYVMLSDIYGGANIVSDFFQWNSDNPGYTVGNNAALKYLTLFHKSDIIRRNITDYSYATKLIQQPIELIENLCELCNLQYRIDEKGIFRIEHVSWWIRTIGLDITQEPYKSQVAGLDKYQYTADKYYRRETFITEGNEILLNYAIDIGTGTPINVSAPYSDPQMTGVPIEYENECLTGTDTLKDYKREVSLITEIFFNAGDGMANQDADFKGTFILAMDFDGNLQHELVQYPEPSGIFPIPEHPNNVLGWPQLHVNYWQHDRIFKVGKMNTHTTTFNTVKRSRIKENVVFTLCTNAIDLFKFVKDSLGNGVIQNYSYRFSTGEVEMDLLFELDNSATVTAPIANDDNYRVLYNTVLNTASDGFASVLANDVGAVSVFAETKNTFRGGTVQLLTNGHFVYTPIPGTIGADNFEYAAINAQGNADIATVHLGIRPANIYVKIVNKSIYIGDSLLGPEYDNLNTVSWFSDAAGIIPLDVTGMGVILHYSNEFPANSLTVLGVGYNQTVQDQTTPDFFTILPDSNYTIIP